MKTEIIDVGNVVLCDLCNKDFTTSDTKGGFLFGSKGVCPDCAPTFEADVITFGEQDYIGERAKPNESFREFVLRIRDGNNTIRITSF